MAGGAAQPAADAAATACPRRPTARAELRIGSTTLQLGSSAELDIVRLDDERLQFALLRGSLALRCARSEVAAELEVLTPEGRFVPLRSGLYRIDRQDEISYRRRLARRVAVPGHGPVAHPAAGPARRVLARRAAARHAQPMAGAAGRRLRAGGAARRPGRTRSAARRSYVSPEMTGVEDLDRYGGWQQHPEYGAVWTPTVVAVGWAPYRHGQWVWLRPWGWTWVDDAPWGFAPFHYGRWLWWGSRWCWAPGPRVARPVYAPALVAWVGGPQFNVHGAARAGAGGGLGAAGAARGLPPGLPRQPRLPEPPEHASAPCPDRRRRGLRQPRHSRRRDRAAGAAAGTAAARGGAALRADEMPLPRQWQAERFQHDAPGRPAVRRARVRRGRVRPCATGAQPVPTQWRPRLSRRSRGRPGATANRRSRRSAAARAGTARARRRPAIRRRAAARRTAIAPCRSRPPSRCRRPPVPAPAAPHRTASAQRRQSRRNSADAAPGAAARGAR